MSGTEAVSNGSIGGGDLAMEPCEPPKPKMAGGVFIELVRAFIASGVPAAKKEFETKADASRFASRMYRAVLRMGAESDGVTCTRRHLTVYLVRDSFHV